MYHFRKTRNKYAGYPKPAVCPFCDEAELAKSKVSETEHAYVMKNRTFYDVWELSRVVDHLMVVPKRHVGSLSELTDAEKAEIMTVIGQYESTDYNVYARAVANKRRSVKHQHTHLIKTNHKMAWFFLHIRKPCYYRNMHFITSHRWLVISVTIALLLLGIGLWQVWAIKFNGTPVAAPNIPRGTEQFGTTGSKLRYVVMGDSTSIGQGAEYGEGIARNTAAYLAQNHQVSLINVGVSGATVHDVLQTQVTKATALKPDVILLAIGANDVTHLTSLKSIEQDLSSIITKLQAANPQVQIVLTGSPAMGSVPRFAQATRALAGWQERRVNRVMATVAHAKHVVLVPLAAKTEATFKRHPEYFASDKFHPNALGYGIWLPVLDAGLDQLHITQ